MGAGISPYRVDIQKLRVACGSNDMALLAELEKEFEFEFDEDESKIERDPQHSDEDWFDASPTDRVLQKQLITGNFVFEGSAYLTSLERLCIHYGVLLPTQCFEKIDGRGKHAKNIDKALQKFGVYEKLNMQKFCESMNLPVTLPQPDDFAGMGIDYFDSPDVEWVLSKMTPLDVLGLDKETAFAIIVLYSWLKAADESGQGLVCFYY
jgi:hypothetical protein